MPTMCQTSSLCFDLLLHKYSNLKERGWVYFSDLRLPENRGMRAIRINQQISHFFTFIVPLTEHPC